MQGSQNHAELTTYLSSNGRVAFVPTTNLSQSTIDFKELFKEQKNILIQTPTTEDFFEQTTINCWLKPQTSYIVLINNALTDYIDSAILHINQNRRNFNAQRFELHKPTASQSTVELTKKNFESIQYKTVTTQQNNKPTDTTDSGIITRIQNLYSQYISPYSHHIALGTLLAFITYLYCSSKKN